MGNVNLPGSILAAGAVLCVLAGFLIGVVAGPDSPTRSSGVVSSYTSQGNKLCLTGDAAAEASGAKDGELCGTWRRSPGASMPKKGDEFRFVSMTTSEAPDGEGGSGAGGSRVYIYGDVIG